MLQIHWSVECCHCSQRTVTNGRLISKWLGKDVEGSISSYLQVLSRNLPVGKG
jgi:hypothetical protein